MSPDPSSALAGFTNGQNGVRVTLNNPPTSGNYTGNTSAYEVIVRQPQTRFFGALLGSAPTVTGRAVALNQSPPCILALDPNASSAIGANGAFNINANNCDIDANSASATAVTLSGAMIVTASHLNVVGNYSKSGAVIVNATIKTGAPATPDPYASLTVPPVSGCLTPTPPFTAPGWTVSGAWTGSLNPGTYCGGITLNGAENLTMNPSVYIINGGSFKTSGATSVTGSGVSIVLTNNTGIASNWGTVSINGASNFTLAAPSSGPMQGIAMFMDRNAPTTLVDAVRGASNQQITGAMYFPTQEVQYSGAASSSCVQLVARKITFNGAGGFGHNCGSLNVPGFRTKGIPAE